MNNPTNIERVAMFWASNEDSWHSQDTVAAVTELSPQTLMNWRAQGKGPDFVKSGKLVYYPKRNVIRWFQGFQASRPQVA